MTPVERLNAAIEKLEQLRVWVDGDLTLHEGPEWCELRDARGGQVAPYMGGFTAELFLTLHRTLPAQIAILRDEQAAAASPGACCRQPWKPAYDLADAILGGA